MFAGFNRVDCLPGDTYLLTQISLTPATFGPKYSKFVVHLNRRARTMEATPYVPINAGSTQIIEIIGAPIEPSRKP